ncbi:hypothetical protein LSAT2_022454 [Lamellibrachia satsuma]|nr:hypothetical protein LSAT2_022454 [Lamellibrachia satsuma]
MTDSLLGLFTASPVTTLVALELGVVDGLSFIDGAGFITDSGDIWRDFETSNVTVTSDIDCWARVTASQPAVLSQCRPSVGVSGDTMPTPSGRSSRVSFDKKAGKSTTSSRRSSLARMSRYYQTPVPCASKFLTMKWDGTAYTKHRLAVLKAKHTIDNAAPRIIIHQTINLNKLQNTELRLVEMERDNAVLLAKMSFMYRNFSYFKEEKSSGNLAVMKSVGKVRLQREFIRITAENHSILQELKAVRTVYPRVKFLDQYEDWKKKVELNARYPISWDKRGAPHYVPQLTPDTRYLQTLLTPLRPMNRPHRGYRRTLTGEVPRDRHGRAFPKTSKKLSMSLQMKFRYHTGSGSEGKLPASGLGQDGQRSAGAREGGLEEIKEESGEREDRETEDVEKGDK